jgi:hypothetical protein
MSETIADRMGELFALQGAQLRAEIAAGMAQTTDAIRLRGARVVPLRPGAALAHTGPGRLVGWSLRDLNVAGASFVTLHDGRSTDGPVLAVIDLEAPTTTQTVWLGPGGVSITEAVFVSVTGSVTGSLYIGAVD